MKIRAGQFFGSLFEETCDLTFDGNRVSNGSYSA